MEDDFSDLFGGSLDFGGGDASSAMVSPYPDATGVAAGSYAPAGMVSPYPTSVGGGATDPAMSPYIGPYLQMLGLPGISGGANPQADLAANPSAAPAAQPAVNPAVAAMLPAWLGLGISGQKAMQGPGMTQGNNPAPYKTAAAPAASGGGMGSLTGNAGSKGIGTASVPITAFFGGF